LHGTFTYLKSVDGRVGLEAGHRPRRSTNWPGR